MAAALQDHHTMALSQQEENEEAMIKRQQKQENDARAVGAVSTAQHTDRIGERQGVAGQDSAAAHAAGSASLMHLPVRLTIRLGEILVDGGGQLAVNVCQRSLIGQPTADRRRLDCLYSPSPSKERCWAGTLGHAFKWLKM